MRLFHPLIAALLLTPLPVVAAPAATPGALSPASPRARERPLTPAADVVVRAAPRPTSLKRFARDADWAHAAPGGKAAVYGTSNLTVRERSGTASRAWLWPGGKSIPVPEIDGRETRFSPDGRHLVVTSHMSPSRGPDGRSWLAARPTLTVLSIPDLRVVAAERGTDPAWISPTTLAFRKGSRAFRFDLDRAVTTPIGPAQPAFGCAAEAFAPSAPSAGCTTDVWTHLWGIDRTMESWVVEDSSMSKNLAAIRTIDLVTGVSRTLVSIHDHGAGASLRPMLLSPNRERMCSWHVKSEPRVSSLLCATLPSGRLERVLAVRGDPGGADWLDDRRLAVVSEGVLHVADLEAHTRRAVTGLPAGTPEHVVALPGGRRVALTIGAPLVVDLAAGTFTRYGARSAELRVSVAPGTDARLLVRLPKGPGKEIGRAFAWADL